MTAALDWYFDPISPFAYLQWVRIGRDHPDIVLRPRPVLLAALLQHHGQLGPAEIAGKRDFTFRFVAWRARQLGITLRCPPAHPFNPLPALRLILAAADSTAATDAVFRHIWQHGRSADSATALRELAAGLGVRDVAAAIAGDDVKAALRAHTEAAIAAGVFGVPTLRVDGVNFWGEDATAMALEFRASPERFAADRAMIAALPVAAERRRATAIAPGTPSA